MLISKAYAQAVEVSASATEALPAAPSATEAFLWNMGMVLVMVVLFYVLLIAPQQRRMKDHAHMLQGLKKGDPVVTGGGLVGTISKIKEGDEQVEVDLGSVKVMALRTTLQGQGSGLLKQKPANDASGSNAKAK
ncbi:MAG: preprotein translocase subunit YajC [Alphaproteobacteria bacterium]|nr:preprotein translocase subunit YajC [Alphaproteobacteria bacterium]